MGGDHFINCSTTEHFLGDDSDSSGSMMLRMHGCGDTNRTMMNSTMSHNETHGGHNEDRDNSGFGFHMDGQHHQNGDSMGGMMRPSDEDLTTTTTIAAMSTISGGTTMPITPLIVATLVGSVVLLDHWM